MNSRRASMAAAVLIVGALALASGLLRTEAQDKLPPQAEPSKGPDTKVDLTAVRKTADAFTAAFNQGDAKAVAAFWTADGEWLSGDSDEAIQGREAIEKAYAEFFKANPKATVAITITGVRLHGRNAAMEEGMLKVTIPGQPEPTASRYTVLHVREETIWKMASVREWTPDPSELISLGDLEPILGTWEFKNKDIEARWSFTWDENKAFVKGTYQVKTAQGIVRTGTQTIAKDPTGGLRSWQFESTGSYGEWFWNRDGKNWTIESVSTLPDGREATGTYLLVVLDTDSFTFQSVGNSIDGIELPDEAPAKLTRVK